MTGWLLIYKVPSEPSTARVAVWRRLRTLGAVPLQQSASFLPDRAEHQAALSAVAREVRALGGEALVLRIEAHAEEAASLRAKLREARDAEYAEWREQAQALAHEVEREGRADKFTFAELEELESGLERLRTWLSRIEGRDEPDSASYASAAGTLAELTEAVGRFAALVYDREARALRGLDET